MTLVEIKGDIEMATLVPDPDLIQGGLPLQAGVLPVRFIENSDGLPADVMVRLRLVLGDIRGLATGWPSKSGENPLN